MPQMRICPTEHEVAKQAANEMVLKGIDKYYFDQRW